MKYFVTVALVLAMAGGSMAAIKTEVVEYEHNGVVLEGFLAYNDELTTPRPGVMVIHAWRGLDDYVKSRCRQLAEAGYVAFGADIYGKGVRPKSTEGASAQATKYRSDRPLMRARAQAGLDKMRSFSQVDTSKTAAIGYCFGGGVALELARSGANVGGVVSFHGNLDTPNPDDAKNITGKVLVCHGGADPHVPAAQVEAFWNEMNAAGVDWRMIAFGNAVHSFTDPGAGSDASKGSAYNPDADRRSWSAMESFFDEVFR